MTTLGYAVPVPGGPPAGVQMVFAAHGRVHGSDAPGSDRHHWDQLGSSPLLAGQWDGVRKGRLNHQLDYDTDWFGPPGDVVSFLAQVVAFGATFGARRGWQLSSPVRRPTC